MQTTRADGVKDWWYTHSESFRQSVYVLILTQMSVVPFANWSVRLPINAHAILNLRWP